MADLWMQGGNLVVNASNEPIECATCPCGMDCICTCSSCPDGAPSEWTFTLAGLTNALCSDCATLNTTFTLVYVSGCIWSATIDFCGAGPEAITFQYSGGQWQLLFPASTGSSQYSLTASATPCTEAKVLSLDVGGASCDNWPATVTVTPVGSGDCTTVCNDCCPDGLPTTLYATLFELIDCACANDVDVTLVWDGTKWAGTTNACAATIEIRLTCTGTACTDFSIQVLCNGVDQGSVAVAVGCTCDPLDLDGDTPISVAAACCGGAGGQITILNIRTTL